MRAATKASCCLLVVTQACIPVHNTADPRQSECDPQPGEIDPYSVRRPSGEVVTKVVRLTDDGEYVRRCELSDALLELKAPAKHDTTKPHPRSLTVIVYIHGWKHDGDPQDSDLRSFRALAQRVADRQQARTPVRLAGSAGGDDASRVVGIYVAWNGRRAVLPAVKELTFWGRKGAADRVSQAAAVTKLIGAIDNILRRRANPNDIVVYVGHSFGARMLFTAVSQVMIHHVQRVYPEPPDRTYGRIDGPGDLVLLVNPAFEASLYTAFNALRRKGQSFQPDQRPVLVTIASENDRATQMAFPAGQLFSLDWRRRVMTTLGNYGPYRTHVLRAASPDGSALSNGEGGLCSVATRICLARTDTGPPRNPFIVATADKSVVQGHNGIWGDRFLGFLADFIVANTTK